MLNLLYGYIENSLQLEELITSPGLRAKADETGHLLPFEGNTVVFLLDDGVKEKLAGLQNRLYQAAGELLSEPLSPATFHMTLHDLANGTPGPDTHRWMAETEPAARAVLTELRQEYAAPLTMQATWMFNMVNTSIVLGLAPADADSHDRLGRMYTRFHSIVPLSYALTPHITLAYFRPGRYGQEALSSLRAALGPVDLRLTLRTENLVLQRFSDMNHYMTI